MSATSTSDSSKSKSAKFSSMRLRVTDLGNTMSPRWRCHRSVTCAGVRPSDSAIRTIVGSSSTLPCAIGLHASVAMPCSASNARTSACVRYGCTSIWFTAGVIVVSAWRRRRCCGWKLETPIALARPDR